MHLTANTHETVPRKLRFMLLQQCKEMVLKTHDVPVLKYSDPLNFPGAAGEVEATEREES